VLLLGEKASVKEKTDASEELKAGCCDIEETLDILIVNIKERIRELQNSLTKSDD